MRTAAALETEVAQGTREGLPLQNGQEESGLSEEHRLKAGSDLRWGPGQPNLGKL